MRQSAAVSSAAELAARDCATSPMGAAGGGVTMRSALGTRVRGGSYIISRSSASSTTSFSSSRCASTSSTPRSSVSSRRTRS